MKKFIWIALLGTIFLSFLGCSQGSEKGRKLKEWMKGEGSLRVLCTTAQVGDLVAEIGGDKAHVWVLIQGDLDPHSYELVKGDDEKILHADLIFYNGLNLEHGASLSSALRASPVSCAVGDKIQEKFPELILTKGAVVDPHLWMDISIWQKAVDPILVSFCQKDPANASYYEERARALNEKMEIAHLALKKKMGEIPEEKRYLITSHDAFRYFTRGYLAKEGESEWQRRFAAPEGLAPDGQLSSIDIQRIIDFVRMTRVAVLFPESNVSRDSIQKIADAGRELKLDVRVCHEALYGDSMGSLSYLEMMEQNGDVMARYLQ